MEYSTFLTEKLIELLTEFLKKFDKLDEDERRYFKSILYQTTLIHIKEN